MPKSSTARKPFVVHPSSESRIEQASSELLEIRLKLKALEEQKKELSERLLSWVRREGEEDDTGKVRYETDLHKFCIIKGKSSYIHELKLRKAMTSAGITPKVQQKCLDASTSKSEHEYVGVFKREDEENAENAETGA